MGQATGNPLSTGEIVPGHGLGADEVADGVGDIAGKPGAIRRDAFRGRGGLGPPVTGPVTGECWAAPASPVFDY